MEKLNEAKIVEEMCRKCNWREKIIISINKKLFIKMYHISRIDIINSILKN